eukprot:4230108-Amphidinium_carterae.3
MPAGRATGSRDGPLRRTVTNIASMIEHHHVTSPPQPPSSLIIDQRLSVPHPRRHLAMRRRASSTMSAMQGRRWNLKEVPFVPKVHSLVRQHLALREEHHKLVRQHPVPRGDLALDLMPLRRHLARDLPHKLAIEKWR